MSKSLGVQCLFQLHILSWQDWGLRVRRTGMHRSYCITMLSIFWMRFDVRSDFFKLIMTHVLEVNIYFLFFGLQIKPVSAVSGTFPRGLSHYVDRGTLEICLHLIVLSLSVVSGHVVSCIFLFFYHFCTWLTIWISCSIRTGYGWFWSFTDL